MAKDLSILGKLIVSVAKQLDEMHSKNCVHLGLCPDSIFVKYNNSNLGEVSIQNYSNSCTLDDFVAPAISEYQPPEILEFIEKMKYQHVVRWKERQQALDALKSCENIWSMDVWSFGVTILEIISGVPVWLPMSCNVQGKSPHSGLFKVKDRKNAAQLLEI